MMIPVVPKESPMNTLKWIAGVSLTLITFAGSGWCADMTPQIQQSGNVSYVSGGVSEEDRAAFDSIVRDFNLKLVFATKNGEYLSDTEVVVSSGRGQPVLEARSDGPWFFARLPSGQYTVTASANGRSIRRSVVVGARGLRTLDFRWDSPDGGPRRPERREAFQ